MRGLLLPEDFDWLAEEAGLTAYPEECAALRGALVNGEPLSELAERTRVTAEFMQSRLAAAADRLAAHEWPGDSADYYHDLLEVMRGPGDYASAPPPPVIGLDNHHPGDVRFAREVMIRPKRVTAEDFTLREQWRGESLVEAAQRDKPERRRKRLKKEQKNGSTSD